jgi:hypothetical protein
VKKSITELTSIIRSKNSGPYELTLDMMFNSEEDYRHVIRENIINHDLISRLYRITPDKIIGIIHFDPAYAIKVTIVRPICSGDLGETDVYGAQQHAPLLSIQVDVPE